MHNSNTNKVNSNNSDLSDSSLPYSSESRGKPQGNTYHNFESSWNEEELVAAIALRIRQSLDLEIILDRTVTEVREFLNTDRVLVYRFEPDLSGVIVVESANPAVQSVFGHKIKDPCFAERHLKRYKQGKVHVIEDIETAKLASCYSDVLKKFEVRANLVVPIVANKELWGLLISHHCHPRHWQQREIKLLKQLSIQVGIAVQQAELYDWVKSSNSYLEQKVKQRTKELENSIKYETLIRKITEKVRDSLDEPQILQTVTQEIGRTLNVKRCKIEFYNSDRTTAKVAYEYTVEPPNCHGVTRKVANFPELYHQLLQKQSLQFVESVLELDPLDIQATRLVCPIYDDRGAMGNLWLLRHKEEFFQESEIMLVEQISAQCAIAIRQARLYHEAQMQIRELGRLNVLKDDFLKTISHELRTPMSSIQLASETLEVLLEKEIGSQRSTTFTKVLNIFRSACDRQNQLVNDLLTLCYIDAKKETLQMCWIDLSVWMPQIVEPFKKHIENQQQKLVIKIEDSPQFRSDLSTIKRVLTELINNACKYTPSNETITVAAASSDNGIQLSVSNTGVEIPVLEQQRVFDKFYRIPHHDPWRFGGTGIGLALIKSSIELLDGKVKLESKEEKTVFKIYLPCETR